MGTWSVVEGDCLEQLRKFPAESVDSLVCDPPAGISFMGREWDSNKGGRDRWIAWLASVLREAYRVLKPGAHGLVWALPRTSHWTGMACEDAGFEDRDKVVHLFGSGFPKSMDVSKVIDKAAGVTERPIVGEKRGADRLLNQTTDGNRDNGETWGKEVNRDPFVRAAVTDAARQWQGWGTALKPAAEDWWLIRKPLHGTVAANVQQFGTGALNIDRCRVPIDPESDASQLRTMKRSKRTSGDGWGMSTVSGDVPQVVSPSGRWPAHLVLSHTLDCTEDTCAAGCAVALLDEQSGASRFFYCAKPSTTEREAGLDDLQAKQRDETRDPDAPGGNNPRNRGVQPRKNHHPTVKSGKLMRYLVRLVTPPGGIVLDPFAGSGTTGIAAMLEGLSFVGIEKDPEYAKIAIARIQHNANTPTTFPPRDARGHDGTRS